MVRQPSESSAGAAVKSGTEIFLYPGEPHNQRKTRRSSSSFLSGRSQRYSFANAPIYSNGGITTNFGLYDLLIFGSTFEGWACAAEANALGAKVGVIARGDEGPDNKAVFWIALRSCLRRVLVSRREGMSARVSFEELRQERDALAQRLAEMRFALAISNVTLLKCSSAYFDTDERQREAAAGELASTPSPGTATKSRSEKALSPRGLPLDGSPGETPRETPRGAKSSPRGTETPGETPRETPRGGRVSPRGEGQSHFGTWPRGDRPWQAQDKKAAEREDGAQQTPRRNSSGAANKTTPTSKSTPSTCGGSSKNSKLPAEGLPYWEWRGSYHPANTRGHRGTWWGIYSPEDPWNLARLQAHAAGAGAGGSATAGAQSRGVVGNGASSSHLGQSSSSQNPYASQTMRGIQEPIAGMHEPISMSSPISSMVSPNSTQRGSVIGTSNGSPFSPRRDLHVVLMDTFRGDFGRVGSPDYAGQERRPNTTGKCAAAEYLFAAGEESLSHGINLDHFQGGEFCTAPEDILEAISADPRWARDGTPENAHLKICLLGVSWATMELCTFLEMAGADITWLMDPIDEHDQTKGSLAEILPFYIKHASQRGRVTVRTDLDIGSVARVYMGGGSSPRKLEKKGASATGPGCPLYIQAKQVNVDWCGPFDLVILPGATRPHVTEVSLCPGVDHDREGRVLVDYNGSAAPQFNSIGPAAACRQAPAGLNGFASDEPGLIKQGIELARLLYGDPSQAAMPLAPPRGLITVNTSPPIGLVGLTSDEARAAFVPPEWNVHVVFSRHQLIDGLVGRFVIGLTCVQLNGGPSVVAGAIVIAEDGGLTLLSGLLVGFAVAIEGRASQEHFERILSAYPAVQNGF